MFEQVVQASEAMRGPARDGGALIPALSGCPDCRTVQMIAAPALGVCEDCGAELMPLGGEATPEESLGALAA